jgi:hypothetical protein
MAYVIVEFPDENNVTAIIQKSWLCNEETCFFPSESYKKLLKETLRKETINKWPKYKIKILYSCNTLILARKKIKALSDVGDTEDEIYLKQKKIEKRKNPVQSNEQYNLQEMIKVTVSIVSNISNYINNFFI